jgi:hypothetical protein
MMPDEAEMAIKSGYAHRLMIDWWIETAFRNIYVLTPAAIGMEGKNALTDEERGLSFSIGRCTFFSKDKLCQIHSSGFKPYECVKEFACDTRKESFRHEIKLAWDTKEAQDLVSVWASIVGFDLDGFSPKTSNIYSALGISNVW